MKTPAPAYESQNEGYGFHGTITSGAIIRAAINQLYSEAAHALIGADLVEHENEAISFLDSRMGRHLADQAYHCKTTDEMIEMILREAKPYIAAYRKEAGR